MDHNSRTILKDMGVASFLSIPMLPAEQRLVMLHNIEDSGLSLSLGSRALPSEHNSTS